MAEQVGTLVWRLRTTRAWSLGTLAIAAGVSKSALSRWESGERQPRVPELEAVLSALGASADLARVLAATETPRAIRRLRQLPPGILGTPPGSGDLLRALRLRRGWSQERLAVALGVTQSAITRWERGERLPSTVQMQALCFALQAREEEMVALTTGGFGVTPGEQDEGSAGLDPDQVLLRLHWMGTDHAQPLADLHYLALERRLWEHGAASNGADGARTRFLLACVLAQHATYLCNGERWSEAGPVAEQALRLTPRREVEPDFVLRAAIARAWAAVHPIGGRAAPGRGIALLLPWVGRGTDAGYQAWVLSDLSKLRLFNKDTAAALVLSERAWHLAEQSDNPSEPYLRHMDHGRLLLLAGSPHEALSHLPEPICHGAWHQYASDLLLHAEVHYACNQAGAAGEWLRQAYAALSVSDLAGLRPQADALAARL